MNKAQEIVLDTIGEHHTLSPMLSHELSDEAGCADIETAKLRVRAMMSGLRAVLLVLDVEPAIQITDDTGKTYLISFSNIDPLVPMYSFRERVGRHLMSKRVDGLMSGMGGWTYRNRGRQIVFSAAEMAKARDFLADYLEPPP